MLIQSKASIFNKIYYEKRDKENPYKKKKNSIKINGDSMDIENGKPNENSVEEEGFKA